MNLRGFLLNTRNDGTLAFRVYGDVDPETGRKSFQDYRVLVDELEIEILQSEADLVTTDEGLKYVRDFRPSSPEERAAMVARAREKEKNRLDAMTPEERAAHEAVIRKRKLIRAVQTAVGDVLNDLIE